MKDFPLLPPRNWFFETPTWAEDLTTMGAAVMLEEDHPDYGRVHGIWWDEDSSRTDGFRPPIPVDGSPFYAAAEAVESFYNGPLVYDEGNVQVGVVPLDHTVQDGQAMTRAELAAARWDMNANPQNGVTVGRIYADTVMRTAGPKAGTPKVVYKFSGSMRHGVTPAQVAMVAASGLSGEWLAGESYGPCWVNRQGFAGVHHGELALAASIEEGPLCEPGDVTCLRGACPVQAAAGIDEESAETQENVSNADADRGDIEMLEQRINARMDEMFGTVNEQIQPALAFFSEAREARIKERLKNGDPEE